MILVPCDVKIGQEEREREMLIGEMRGWGKEKGFKGTGMRIDGRW